MRWPWKRKVGQRRLEVRRNIPSRRGSRWRRFVQAGGPMSLVLAVAFVLTAATLTVWPIAPAPYAAGQIAPKLYARVPFEAPSEERTGNERDAAANRTPATYVTNQALLREIGANLQALPESLRDLAEREKVPASLRDRFQIQTDQDLAALRRLNEDPSRQAYLQAVPEMMRRLSEVVIISQADFDRDAPRHSGGIKLRTPAGERSALKSAYPPEILVLQRRHQALIADRLRDVVAPLAEPVRPHVYSYLQGLIAPEQASDGRATYLYDAALTAADIEAAVATVPPQTVRYPADSVIFTGGEVTPASAIVLNAEQRAWRRHLAEADPLRRVRIAAGRGSLVALVTLLLGVYISRYQRRIVRNHLRGLGLGMLLVLMLGLTKAMVTVAGWNPYLAVAPVALGAIIVTIAYEQRFGLLTGLLLALLTTLALRADVGMFLTLLAPVGVNVFLLGEIRTRSKLIEVGGVAAVAAFVVALLTQLAAGAALERPALLGALWAGGAALGTGFIIQGILPLIERLFRVVTAMTLLEWADANRRLLKRLALEAPGTYNHSLQLGTLSEAAAEAIGANGLLARVGAYYHDIGKINKPDYFIENQMDSLNRHAKLSPAMSLLVITGHVKDGLEMAREYNLPPALQEFIAAHHGTTLVQYFYHAATQQRKANGDDRLPDEIEFRYPGPKPHTKEVAILMLADATESSVRAMTDPTPARIESQAHAITSGRLMDGQLDDCDLTLREVHIIEKSLVKSLCGIYHGRIAYPKTHQPAKPIRASGGAPA